MYVFPERTCKGLKICYERFCCLYKPIKKRNRSQKQFSPNKTFLLSNWGNLYPIEEELLIIVTHKNKKHNKRTVVERAKVIILKSYCILY